MNEEPSTVDYAIEAPEESTMTVREAMGEIWKDETPIYQQTLLRAAVLARQRIDNQPRMSTTAYTKRKKKNKQSRIDRKRNRR